MLIFSKIFSPKNGEKWLLGTTATAILSKIDQHVNFQDKSPIFSAKKLFDIADNVDHTYVGNIDP
jgi:hypothetical protein